MTSVESRMIRKRLFEALSKPEDWKVVETNRIERQDGLIVVMLEKPSMLAIMTADHGVPQATVDPDPEIRKLWWDIIEIGNGTDPARRPALKLLGAVW